MSERLGGADAICCFGQNDMLDVAPALSVIAHGLVVGVASSIQHPTPPSCTSQGALDSMHGLVWGSQRHKETASKKQWSTLVQYPVQTSR